MKPIPFSGMMCNPLDIQKDGQFRIKGVMRVADNSHPEIARYEYFPATYQRDERFEAIKRLRKGDR